MTGASDLGVTPAQLREVAQEDISDSLAIQVIGQASAVVISHCGWRLTRGIDTVVRLGDPAGRVQLPTRYLLAVTGLAVDGTVQDHTRVRAVRSGLVVGAPGWAGSERSVVEVSYDHGYDNVPEALQHVVLSMATRMVQAPGGGLTQETAKSWSGSYVAGASAGLMGVERDILSDYRVIA